MASTKSVLSRKKLVCFFSPFVLTALTALGSAAALADDASATASSSPAAAAVSYDERLKKIAGKENYLGQLVAKEVDCWPEMRIPIEIYVHPADKVPGYKPYYLDILKSALSQWSEASQGKITFAFVNKVPTDGIEMTWKASPAVNKRQVQEGVSQIHSDREGIKSATVEVFTFPEDKALAHGDCITLIGCLHEIGHALGLQGHSAAGADLMCPDYHIAYNATPDKIKLTDRDKKTILALLALGPRKDPANAAREDCVQLNNLAVIDINKGDFKQAIDKLEKCLNLDPKYKLAIDNLEVCYTNYALQKYQQKHYDETAALLVKRLACLDGQSKPDRAKLIETLNVYVFCLNQLGQTEEAKKAQERLDALNAQAPKHSLPGKK